MSKPTGLDPKAPSQDGESVKTFRPNTVPIFALTIGINEYEHQGDTLKNLSGCVADANDVEAFLSENLHVPSANITSLRNKQATVANITEALKSLGTDTRIPKDAIIFIFYAGHGTQAPAPTNNKLPDSKQIQMLMPYDFYPGPQSSHATASSETSALGDQRSDSDATADPTVIKNGLFDIQLGKLIENIANSKGKNITVVFDCCHSGSATRGQELLRVRGVKLPPGSKLDVNDLSAFQPDSNRGGKVPKGDENRGLACHVLLTACDQEQPAYEKGGRGVFTSALMDLLRKSKDLEQFTYSDIIESLPVLPSQKPQCEGVNKDHIFLNNRAVNSRCIFHSLAWNGSEYKINAGEAHGVTVGTDFAIYDNRTCTNDLGRLVVKSSSPFHSFLEPAQGAKSFDIPEAGAFALQIGITQDLHILVEGDGLTQVVEDVEREASKVSATFRPSFKIVDDNPDLILTASSDGTVHFEIKDMPSRDAGLYALYHHPKTDRQTMANVLLGAARFYRNLRFKTSTKDHISSKIGFGCYELSRDGLDDSLCPLMKCANEHNLFVKSSDTNSLVHGNIKLVIDGSDKSYGFHIENKSGVHLFVSVFYFNMSDLSIDAYYQPPAARGQDQFPSIEPGGSLTIGYGTGGSPPQAFYLEENQKVDVGYIKLFLTTQHVDYSSIPQQSPFKVDDGRGSAPQYPNSNLWGTMLIRVVQGREGTTMKA